MDINLQRREPAPLDPRAEQVMVPMRDRVRLATDLYLPPGPGRHPAVLVRLPYDKCGRYTFMPQAAPFFNERGYAFVVQDVRGKFRSEGETLAYVHEVEDGYDTLEWIVAQSWSNGVVGMFGDSYYGFTQWAAVAGGHPALRAIVPRVTSANVGTSRLGTRWDEHVPLLYGADYFARNWVDTATYEFDVDWTHRPLSEVFDEAFRAIGARSAAFDLLLRNSRERTAFTPYPSRHPFDMVEIPVLHAGGWLDNLAPDQMADYMALRSQSERASLQYLVMDASDHENYFFENVPITFANDHDVNDEALARLLPIYLGPALDFYDVFLQRRGDASSLRPVRWRLTRDGWRSAESWPPAGTHELRLYLSTPERAPADADGGDLSLSPQRAVGAVRWIHDPNDLVPSTVKNPWAFLYEYPDERAVESRHDVLTFTGEALERPLDLAGPVSAWLAVRSSGPSMHLFVKLVDVDPDGSAHMIARGQSLVRAPDESRPGRVDLGHIGYRLEAGHRLRLHVACSDVPLYVPHPGTAENPWFATSMTPNQQTLVTGAEAASYVALRVIDPEP